METFGWGGVNGEVWMERCEWGVVDGEVWIEEQWVPERPVVAHRVGVAEFSDLSFVVCRLASVCVWRLRFVVFHHVLERLENII